MVAFEVSSENDDGTTDEIIYVPPRTTGNEKGVCKVCGNPARSPSSVVCDEHDGRRTKGGATATGERRPRTPRGGKAPTADDWSNKVFGKVLAMLTIIMATSMVNRRLPNLPDGEMKEGVIDTLAMSNTEARDIARPFGRLLAGTKVSKVHGHKVIDNLDVIDACWSFYEWQDRVNKFIAATKRTHLASVQQIREPTTEGGVTNEPTAEEVGDLGFGYDANRNAVL